MGTQILAIHHIQGVDPGPPVSLHVPIPVHDHTHRGAGWSPRQCDVEMAMAEHGSRQEDSGSLPERLALTLVYRHGPGELHRELVSPHPEREITLPGAIAGDAWEEDLIPAFRPGDDADGENPSPHLLQE